MPTFDFNAEDLSHLRRLSFTARLPVMTRQEGQHRYRRAGEGLEFLDYRPYIPGDDLRHIDWSLYGRLRQLVVRVFEKQENLSITILVDTSQSMAFGKPVSKSAHACRVACGLSYVAVAGGERLRVGTFAHQLSSTIGPFQNAAQLGRVIEHLRRSPEGGLTNFSKCLRTFCGELRQRGLVIVISDFLGGDGYDEALRMVLARGCKLSLIQVLDGVDVGIGLDGYLRVRDSETNEERLVFVDEGTRRTIRKRADAHCAALAAWARRYQQTYVQTWTSDDCLEIVGHAARSQMGDR